MGTERCESTEQRRDWNDISEEEVVLWPLLLQGLLIVGSPMLSRGCTWYQKIRDTVILHTTIVLLRYHIEFGNFTHFRLCICPAFRRLVCLDRTPAWVYFTCRVDLSHQPFPLIMSTQ